MDETLLKIIADNPSLFSTLKAFFEKKFTTKITPEDVKLSNEILGERTKAQINGLLVVEEAFREIAKHKTPPPASQPVNQAR